MQTMLKIWAFQYENTSIFFPLKCLWILSQKDLPNLNRCFLVASLQLILKKYLHLWSIQNVSGYSVWIKLLSTWLSSCLSTIITQPTFPYWLAMFPLPALNPHECIYFLGFLSLICRFMCQSYAVLITEPL